MRGPRVVPGDGVAIAARILLTAALQRLGRSGERLMQGLDLPRIVAIHRLQRPVSALGVLMTTAFDVVQTAVLAANKRFMRAPLLRALAPEATRLASWRGPMAIFWARRHTHTHPLTAVTSPPQPQVQAQARGSRDRCHRAGRAPQCRA